MINTQQPVNFINNIKKLQHQILFHLFYVCSIINNVFSEGKGGHGPGRLIFVRIFFFIKNDPMRQNPIYVFKYNT